MDHDNKSDYEETFYITPRKIRKLKGITLAYIDVYETIFQFWNKSLPCFLSNASIQNRTGLGHTQINKALIFFEKNLELERRTVNGRRYLVQPIRQLETDLDNSTPTAGAAPPYRESGTPPTAGAVHNIKNLNKESNTILSSTKDNKKKISASDYEKDVRFMRFYKAYPIQKKGAHAYKMWLRLNPDDDMLEMILNDIQKRMTQDSEWLDGFMPHPGTYLNPQSPGFKDEIVDRNKIAHDSKKAKQELQAKANKEREYKQLIASQKRADEERLNNERKRTDAKAMQNLNNKVQSRTGMKSFKDMVYGSKLV